MVLSFKYVVSVLRYILVIYRVVNMAKLLQTRYAAPQNLRRASLLP